jgi:hypothetical protein
MASSWPSEAEATDDITARCTLAARALRCSAMSAAFVLIIVVALLCIAMLALFGALWVALHFGSFMRTTIEPSR